MAITHTISANLGAWMEKSADLNTLKKLAARSGVGFGTVQRMKNGDGNPTIKNITDVARAFGKRPEDLLLAVPALSGAAPLRVAEPEAKPHANVVTLDTENGTRRELANLVMTMSDTALKVLLYEAKKIDKEYPAAKANPAS